VEKTGYIVVLITASSEEEAQKISQVLLEKRRVACVNVVPKVKSQFWWQGKIDNAEEFLLIIKTKSSALSDVIKLVKTNHSYTVPEIIALPVVGGNEDYLDWIGREVME